MAIGYNPMSPAALPKVPTVTDPMRQFQNEYLDQIRRAGRQVTNEDMNAAMQYAQKKMTSAQPSVTNPAGTIRQPNQVIPSPAAQSPQPIAPTTDQQMAQKQASMIDTARSTTGNQQMAQKQASMDSKMMNQAATNRPRIPQTQAPIQMPRPMTGMGRQTEESAQNRVRPFGRKPIPGVPRAYPQPTATI